MGLSTGCKIGATGASLATLASINVSYPVASYFTASERVKAGDGTFYGRGFDTAEWFWPYLSQAEIDVLRTYVTNSISAAIAITTPINNGRTYDDFDCVAEWPSDETGTDFRLRFSRLVEYTP